MKSDESVNITETYFSLLKNLSIESKLELIAKLVSSMKGGKEKPSKNWREELKGFIPEKSADELILELKEARVFNKDAVKFD